MCPGDVLILRNAEVGDSQNNLVVDCYLRRELAINYSDELLFDSTRLHVWLR